MCICPKIIFAVALVLLMTARPPMPTRARATWPATPVPTRNVAESFTVCSRKVFGDSAKLLLLLLLLTKKSEVPL